MFAVANKNVAYIDGNGNVGIGTTSGFPYKWRTFSWFVSDER